MRVYQDKTPARCRGQVQLLNLHDQVGPPRDASGFSLHANMLTTSPTGVPDLECWLKSNRPPRAGQGLVDNLSERNPTIKGISTQVTRQFSHEFDDEKAWIEKEVT